MSYDVQILDHSTAFEGFFRVDRYRLRHRLHGGGWSAPVTREVFERGHSAAILPYDPVRDEVVLIEQFRPGPLAAGDARPWMVEIVAGIIEEGETAEAVVRREAMEEAGLEIGPVAYIADAYTSPGGCSERVALFCGRCDASGAGGLHGNPEENEDIRVFTLPFAEVPERLAAGAVDNVITLITLQWLCLHRDRVREEWR